MTDEKLEILCIPKVQAFIQEETGDCVVGDKVYLPGNKAYGLGIVKEINKKEKWICIQFSKNYSMRIDHRHPGIVRRPIVCDPDRPERGLIGMCEDFRELIFEIDTWYCRCGRHNSTRADTPELALLKAIKWQISQKKGEKG